MHIEIITVGKIKEKYLTQGIEEYLKRLKPFCQLNIIELPEEKMPLNPSSAEKEIALVKEGERILRRINPSSRLFVLDVAGKLISSEDLADKFKHLALSGKSNITFIIGGAFGLSPQLRAAAHERISLSKMTFTHQMVRLIIIEQIYRAFKINRGEPYHW